MERESEIGLSSNVTGSVGKERQHCNIEECPSANQFFHSAYMAYFQRLRYVQYSLQCHQEAFLFSSEVHVFSCFVPGGSHWEACPVCGIRPASSSLLN